MEKFVHFEEFIQIIEITKKIFDLQEGKGRNSECRASQHKNEGATRALRVSETAIINSKDYKLLKK
jgi:hypothetical protein